MYSSQDGPASPRASSPQAYPPYKAPPAACAKKAAPPPRWSVTPQGSSSEDTPASSRDLPIRYKSAPYFRAPQPVPHGLRKRPTVTLRLYLPNGDFIKEDVVDRNLDVWHYVQDLEEGTIEPTLLLPSPWDPSRSSVGPWYQLVWKDMVLSEGNKFSYYVQHLGMSSC